MKPFLKWAGGKRWFVERSGFELPEFEGNYIEPFLGSGAVFFHLEPKNAILSDANSRLIDTYKAIRDDWQKVYTHLKRHQKLHSDTYYYEERAKRRISSSGKAAQFIYLNRTCWNGLYRENLKGEFNVPKGTKDAVLLKDDDFESVSNLLKNADIDSCDFEETIANAQSGDLLFVDPPYTTAHNMNGFVKYNQKIFSWDDQIRLRNSIRSASAQGVKVVLTNANHSSVLDLYDEFEGSTILSRNSVISGQTKFRGKTSEFLLLLE